CFQFPSYFQFPSSYFRVPIPVLLFPSSDSSSPSIPAFQFPSSYSRPPISNFQFQSFYFRPLISVFLFPTSALLFLFDSRPPIPVFQFPSSDVQLPFSSFYSLLSVPVLSLLPASNFHSASRSAIAVVLFAASTSYRPIPRCQFPSSYFQLP